MGDRVDYGVGPNAQCCWLKSWLWAVCQHLSLGRQLFKESDQIPGMTETYKCSIKNFSKQTSELGYLYSQT